MTMSRWLVASWAVSVLAACSGAQPCASSSCGDGGSDGRADAGQVSFRAYALTIDGATIDTPVCYRDNAVPSTPDVEPPRTLEVLVWDTPSGASFVALKELQPYTLGESPTITPPGGLRARTAGMFVFDRASTSRYPGLSATESRHTQLTLTFADASAPSTTGTLELRSSYGCTPGNDACPTPNPTPDSAWCALQLAFTAQQVPVTSKWSTPAGALLSGGTKYLVATRTLDVVPIPNPSCYRSNQLPVTSQTAENGSVVLDVWQRSASGDALRTAPMTYQLGEAPTVQVAGDFVRDGGVYEAASVTSSPFPGVQATELRERRVTFAFDAGVEVTGSLEVSARYTCVAGAEPCPSPNPTPDSASCEVLSGFTAVRLP